MFTNCKAKKVTHSFIINLKTTFSSYTSFRKLMKFLQKYCHQSKFNVNH